MSAHGFRSVFMVGAIAGTALSCYLVSLRVASERAALESVENRIVLAQRDIRLLETEIGTRGRLSQLERWNVKVIRLSAPSADQFVEGAFQLATLVKPEKTPVIDAPVVLAAAPLPMARAPISRDESGTPPTRGTVPLGDMMHVAGYSKPAPAQIKAETAPRRATSGPRADAATVGGSTKAKGATTASSATKSAKTATADPLAPLSGGGAKARSGVGAGMPRATTPPVIKDSGSRQ